MDKMYRKPLMKCTTKQNKKRKLFIKRILYSICTICFLLTGTTINYAIGLYLTHPPRNIPEIVINGTALTMMEVFAVAVVLGLIVNIRKIPLLLKCRHLPETQEELSLFNFRNDAEFIDFLMEMCSYKIKRLKCLKTHRIYVLSLRKDIFKTIILYTETKRCWVNDLIEKMPKDFYEYLFGENTLIPPP